jgi:hypothetical protein
MAEGFRPDVKSFFALPYTGMKPGQPKNALFLSLLPGEVAASTNPGPEPTPTPGNGGGNNGGTQPGTGNGMGKVSGAGACSIGELGGGEVAGMAGLAAVYALTIAAVIRRRLHENGDKDSVGGES